MYHYYILLFIFMTFKLIVYNINVLKQRSMTQSAPLTFHLKWDKIYHLYHFDAARMVTPY